MTGGTTKVASNASEMWSLFSSQKYIELRLPIQDIRVPLKVEYMIEEVPHSHMFDLNMLKQGIVPMNKIS